jgi:integrase
MEAVAQILTYVENAPIPERENGANRERLRILRDRAFLLTLASTGLRVSEICELRCHNLDQITGTLHLTTGETLTLPAGTRRAVRAYLDERRPLDESQPHHLNPDLPLFARHDKRAGRRVLPISRWTGANIVEDWVAQGLSIQLRQELDKKGQSITPHTLRHYFVLATLSDTGSIETTQQLARHADRATTRRYLRSISEQPDSQKLHQK